jgi:hypothetical protein
LRIWIRNTAFFKAKLRICDLRTGTARKLGDSRFAEYSLRICDLQLPLLRNMRCCDCGMSQRIAICELTKKNCVPTFNGYKVPCTNGKNLLRRDISNFESFISNMIKEFSYKSSMTKIHESSLSPERIIFWSCFDTKARDIAGFYLAYTQGLVRGGGFC